MYLRDRPIWMDADGLAANKVGTLFGMRTRSLLPKINVYRHFYTIVVHIFGEMVPTQKGHHEPKDTRGGVLEPQAHFWKLVWKKCFYV